MCPLHSHATADVGRRSTASDGVHLLKPALKAYCSQEGLLCDDVQRTIDGRFVAKTGGPVCVCVWGGGGGGLHIHGGC